METNFKVSPSFASRSHLHLADGRILKMTRFGETGPGVQLDSQQAKSHWGIFPNSQSVSHSGWEQLQTPGLFFFLARRARRKCEKFTWREKFHFFTFAFFTTTSRFETL